MIVGEEYEARQEPEEAIFISPPRPDYARRAASARGLYRIFNGEEYRFYRSNSVPPTLLDVPFASSQTLPYTPTDTYADGTWLLSMTYFNGVLESGFFPIGVNGQTYKTIEISSGAALDTRPSAPTNVTLAQLSGGVVRVSAVYNALVDGTNAATEWSISYTVNSAHFATVILPINNAPFSILAYNLIAQSTGDIVEVTLEVRRGSTYNLTSIPVSITIQADGPTAPIGISSWVGNLPEGSI